MRSGPTTLSLGTVDDDDYAAFARTTALAFGEPLSDDAVAHYRSFADFDRTVAARDGDRIVGTAVDIAFTMSVPHAPPVACAGVTAVGVAPTHRRRGVLRAMMRHQLDAIHARGDAWAALYASESAIYGRFGYGVASRAFDVTIGQPWARVEPPAEPGAVELVTLDDASSRIPAIHRAAHAGRPGMMQWSPSAWRAETTWDPADERHGAGPRMVAVIDDRAFAWYRISRDWDTTGPRSTLTVELAVAADADAERALWSFLFGVDLIAEFKGYRRPVDDPLAWWLADRQRLRRTEAMPCYLRLVDVGAALAQRGTRADTAVVLDVVDGFCPWNERRWHLEGDGAALRCTATDRAADVRLDVRELASLSVGGVAAQELAHARLIEARSPDAVDRLSALLASARPPWQPFVF